MPALIRYAHSTGSAIWALCLAAVATAAAGIAVIILLGATIGAIPTIDDAPTLFWLSAAGLVAAFALEATLPVAISLATSRAVYNVEPAVHRQIVEPLLNNPGVSHLEDPDVQDRVQRARGIGSFGVRAGIEALGPLIVSRTAAFGAALLVGWSFSWIVAGIVLATTWLTEWYSARLLRAESDQLADQTELQRKAAYTFGLAMNEAGKELRVFGLSGWFVSRYSAQWNDAMKPLWRERRWAAMRTLAVYGLHMAVLVGSVALAGFQAARGDLAIAEVTTVGVALLRLGLAADGHSASRMRRGIDAYRAATSLANLVTRREPTHRADIVNGPVVLFDDVWFRYPNNGDDVLRGVSFELHTGRSTALVGVNGAGKSTIVKLLTGVHFPTRGAVYVNGHDTRSMSAAQLAEWQRSVATVMQDFIRLPLSAAENVVMGDEPDDCSLNEVARVTGADDVVAGLASGWNTTLDKSRAGGADLSGGQWQRLAVARAVWALRRGARVLVLDEPAAALDVRAEAAMVDRYLELTSESACLIISHRFSVVRDAQSILVLNDGQVVENGDHDALLAEGGHYATMFTVQADRYREPR